MKEKLERIKKLLELIAGGFTIPGYRGPHQDERLAMLQEVMHADQVHAREALVELTRALEELS